MSEQLEELIKTQNVVKQKFEHLKDLKNETEKKVIESFKPITKELKEIVQNTKQPLERKKKLKSLPYGSSKSSSGSDDNDEDEKTDEDDEDDDDESTGHENKNHETMLHRFLLLLHNNSNLVDFMYGVYFDNARQEYKIGSLVFEPKGDNFFCWWKNFQRNSRFI